MWIMRQPVIGFFILAIFFLPAKTWSQFKSAILEKNVNVLAKDLRHELNATQDTLILSSKRKIDYVYSINRQNKREIDRYIDDYSAFIPLQNLSPGKHLFAVSYLQRKILFVVRIYDPNSTYLNLSREEDVASRNN